MLAHRLSVLVLSLSSLSACDANRAGSSITEQLDDRVIEGCYASPGVPDLHFADGRVTSEDKPLYAHYDYARAGRANAPVVLVRPRMALTEVDGGYRFEPWKQELGSTMSYDVRVHNGQYELAVISSPDAVKHIYKRSDCRR